MTRAWAVVLAMSLGCAGCTAIVQVTPTACAGQTFCDPLNLRDHYDVATACFLWRCHRAAGAASGTCVRGTRDRDDDGATASMCGGTDCDDTRVDRSPSLPETCDGVDNDCDFVIDEHAPFAPMELARTSAGAASAVFTDGLALTVSSGTNSLAGSIVLPPQGGFGTSSSIATQAHTTSAAPAPPCMLSGTCSVFEVAVSAAGPADPVAAAITHDGCASGALLLGALSGNEISIVGHTTAPVASTSTVFPSVEHLSGDICSGATGATRPAVSLLQGTSTIGLLAWIADSSATRGCPGASADVRVLGFAGMPRFVGAPPVQFMLATGGGVGVALGATTACTAPALVSVGSSGWLIAIAVGSTIEIHYIPSFPMPPDPPIAPAPVLPDPSRIATIPSAASEIAIAIGGSAAGVEVALAWASGGAVHLVTFPFDPAAPTATTVPSPVDLGSGTRPSVARASPFTSSDDPRAHAQAWLASWENGGAIDVARVLDGALVEPAYVASSSASAPSLVVRTDRTDLFALAGSDLVQLAVTCGVGP